MGLITWPLPLDRFTWLKYLDPIVLWDFQDFVRIMDRVRALMGLPLSLKPFATVTVVTHYCLVTITGTIQWFLVGIVFERIASVLESRRSVNRT